MTRLDSSCTSSDKTDENDTQDKRLKSVSFAELVGIFSRCHDIIWSGGRVDPSIAFDEMTKILFAKVYDELSAEPRHEFRADPNETSTQIAERVRRLYQNAIQSHGELFSDPLSLDDQKLSEIVRLLQSISLLNTDIDAKGHAFETFLGTIFRGRLGQYFTRRQIIEFAVDFLEPTEQDVILDPCCGSGGFLLASLRCVVQAIERKYAGDPAEAARHIQSFCRDHLFGIDINRKIARVALMDLMINHSSCMNIEVGTGLDNEFKNPSIGFGRFTLILTNPPFGVKVRDTDTDILGNNSLTNFELAYGRQSCSSDILFLEQYHRFLKDDESSRPRVGVVCQVGVINNPSNRKVIDWLKRKFRIIGIVALPEFAFRKAGSGMRTVLLFLEKYSTSFDRVDEVSNYPVFMAIANHIGYDSTLRPDGNDLPTIYEKYRAKIEDGTTTMWVNFSELDDRLDPKFYFNRRRIWEQLDIIEKHGVSIVSLADILEDLSSGKSPAGGVRKSTGEVISITVSNITRDGNLNLNENISYVPLSFYEEFTRKRGTLQIGDILMAKDGATTGKTVIIDETSPLIENNEVLAVFTEHVFRLRVKQEINAFYVHAFLNSDLGRLQLETIVSGGAQGGITRDFAKHIFVPIPSREVQNKIADMWNQGMARVLSLKKLAADSLEELRISVISSLLS